MKRTHLAALFLAPFIVASSSCSVPKGPFDIKGTWEATKGDCGSYCKFIVSDNIEKEKPTKLYIIFMGKDGENATAYNFYPSKNKNKGDEWVFEAPSGYGYLYLKDRKLMSMADITFEKVSDATFDTTTKEKK